MTRPAPRIEPRHSPAAGTRAAAYRPCRAGIAATAVAMATVGPALAQGDAPRPGPSVLSEHVVAFDWGVYCPDPPSGREEAPGVATGHVNLHARTPDFRWQQAEVPAALGIGFGVGLQVDPADLPPDAVVTMTHPPYPDDAVTTERWVTALSTASPGLNGFSFDFDWELVLGTWTLRAETPEEVLYEITFEVVPSSQYPEIVLTCLGGALS